MAEEEKQQYKFDVFISYRHADLDSAVAGYLQKALEHYKIPKEIQQKCGKARLNRVFRDEEELGVASDLFNEIEQNLKQSEFLLVICSPRVVESKWCRREIETFIKYHGRENILAVLIEGEPEESFPPILLEEGEPLAADLRGKNKREVLKHAKERMPRLVAPLLYCSYDDLYQRHRIYKMRRAVALTGLVAAVSLAFGVVTVKQNLEITKNYTAKLENQSRYLAETSTTLLEQGDREAALLVALEALPKGSGDDSRPYVAEARVALENALNTYRLDYLYTIRPQKVLKHSGPIAGCTDFDEAENVLFTVEGQLAWGHTLHINDIDGNHMATVKQRIFSFLPKFDLYEGETLVGTITKDFTFFKPSFDVDCNGWHVEGDFFEWDYDILDKFGDRVASVSKELWNWTDTYSIDVTDPADALYALMVVLAIDAEKDSRQNNH